MEEDSKVSYIAYLKRLILERMAMEILEESTESIDKEIQEVKERINGKKKC